MNSIKAIALDIDGTITDHTRKVCISAIESIRKAENAGIPVIIVTGNILCFTRAVSVFLGTSGGLVAENGGVILSQGQMKVLGDIKKAENAYNYLKTQAATREKVHRVPFSEMRVSEIALFRNMPADIIKDVLRDQDVEIYDTKFALHLTDPMVNKGSSLEIVAHEMGIKTKNIMAAGDSENDIDFLKVAGYKVAVANADIELKDIADYVTKKTHGDGVAEAIERFVLSDLS
ncbi:MAG: phosphoglycolate phosphatase [Methanobacteriaceae archaeon]|uniref:phosphoglycolate phosphatase n=1 Tax=Sulfuricurvum sp. TaxID=2025608 RepID=UPI0027251825|nr:phosphoglycolate phosphatase [Sulfuricurvum sp.]MDO9056380.1 phosphoglycolate phosphatase [Sulfuricurvum sp.]MDP2836990.1 phosphoglycolate phosphatase [Methanobacteriaceae archaeon]